MNPWYMDQGTEWCPSCGEPISGEDLDFMDCPVCGYPDDGEAMGRYHNQDWEEDNN